MAISLKAHMRLEFLIPLFPFLFGKGLRGKVPSRKLEKADNSGLQTLSKVTPKSTSLTYG